MSQRLELVMLAQRPGVNFRELCRRFRISPKTGYKWLRRYQQQQQAGLEDRSRRPHRSPRQYAGPLEEPLLRLYRENGWGGRKLRQRLLDMGFAGVPAASTCTEILRRAGAFAQTPPPTPPWQRFERAHPNELWQMDFKGEFATQAGAKCYPLTVLDDHSRFNVALDPAANRNGTTVQRALTTAFQTYGLPERILCDNAPPWGAAEPVCPYTTFTVWLLRLGVSVCHGRPYHPQTQGKDERFHRTLQQELLSRHTWRDLAHCAVEFSSYRQRYNCERPHDALANLTPVRRYQPSPRPLPSHLPGLEYSSDTTVRLVRSFGGITFGNQTWYIGRAFAGLAIGLRPSPQADGQWQVWFMHHLLGQLDLRSATQPKHKLRSIYQS